MEFSFCCHPKEAIFTTLQELARGSIKAAYQHRGKSGREAVDIFDHSDK
jgi:hypothetical protein